MPKGSKRTRTKRKPSDASQPLEGSAKRRKSDNSQSTQSRSGTPAKEPPATIIPTSGIPKSVAVPNEAGPEGPFHKAHDFVVNNLVIGNPASHSDVEAMKTVTEHIIEGAEHDSSARDPPPRCQEGTRKTLQNNMSVWFDDEKREKKFLWINGPAGVGKSAVMQTAAESMAEANRLAATAFFSLPNGRHDAKKVVPTLAYQLALRVPGYRPYLVEQTTLNPRVFTKSIRELFRKFIIDPFVTENIYRTGPNLCILLDGLDECGSKDDQCTIVDLISEFVFQYPTIPLVWIVASRPEDHLKSKFLDSKVAASHWQLYVPIDDDEARQDVERFLRGGFEEVRQKYPNGTSRDWPTEAEFRKVTDRASGLFVFAFTVKRFLEDPDIANPIAQLEVLISIIDGISTPFADNPFATLDALYTRIVGGIHPQVKSNAELLIGHLLIRGDTLIVPSLRLIQPYTLVMVSNVLGLRMSNVYSALRGFHSVLSIPSQVEAHEKHFSFLHASFADFLKDSRRSGTLALDLTYLNTKLWEGCHRIRLQINQDSTCPFPNLSTLPLVWAPNKDVVLNGVGKPVPFRQLLIYETLHYWPHYLIPGICPCPQGGPFHDHAPQAGFLITPSERLGILQSIHWNKLAGGYFQDDSLHLKFFVAWIFQCWQGQDNELKVHRIGKQIALKDFNLDLIDTTMAGYERGIDSDYIKMYYSGTETSHGFITTFKPIQALLSSVASLQQREPDLRVIILGKSPTAGALLGLPLHGTLAFYFLPLK